MLTEKQFDFFFEKAQRRTESCPEPLRSKHRACLRGMRAAWMGLTDDLPPDQIFAELWSEVFGTGQVDTEQDTRNAGLRERVIERLNAGQRPRDIACELQCSPSYVSKLKSRLARSAPAR